MSRSDKSQKNGHPLRKLLFLAVIAGIVVAIKNALEDKGGSYDGPAAAQPSASVPTPPVPTVETAEDVVEKRPVENLDEFADPVEPGVESVPEPIEEPAAVEPEPEAVEETVVDAEPVADAPEAEESSADETPLRRKPRTQPPTAGTLADAESPEELRTIEDVDVPGKIDPFGIR